MKSITYTTATIIIFASLASTFEAEDSFIYGQKHVFIKIVKKRDFLNTTLNTKKSNKTNLNDQRYVHASYGVESNLKKTKIPKRTKSKMTKDRKNGTGKLNPKKVVKIKARKLKSTTAPIDYDRSTKVPLMKSSKSPTVQLIQKSTMSPSMVPSHKPSNYQETNNKDSSNVADNESIKNFSLPTRPGHSPKGLENTSSATSSARKIYSVGISLVSVFITMYIHWG